MNYQRKQSTGSTGKPPIPAKTIYSEETKKDYGASDSIEHAPKW